MRTIGWLMVLEAVSLAVMSSLHLAGGLDGNRPFEPTRAGIAEAVIGVVLLGGGLALLRRARNAWGIALVANVFAITGFAVGLTRTTQGGGALDIGYHIAVLPLLLLTLVALLRRRTWSPST